MKTAYLVDSKLILIALALTCSGVTRAAWAPIALTANSYSQDMVVEKTAIHEPSGPPPLTTATFDGGAGNYGDTFYEQGYDTNYPDTGLPAHGSTITSESQPDHSYTLASSYAGTNNVVLVDGAVTNATITLTTPAAYSAVSFLGVSGGGSAALAYEIHHSNGTTEGGTVALVDWFTGLNYTMALTANGRVNVNSLGFDSEESGHPSLYAYDLTLTNTTSPITAIDLNFAGGGHAGIFALSGSTGTGFSPIAMSGYNEDMIVESNIYVLPTPTPLNATTATMGNGTNDTSVTWYQQGYDTAAPGTGLPAAGSTITSASDPTVSYTFAPSYATNNAMLIDADNGATLTPTTPTNCSALSFLEATCNGPSTINYIINFSDGTAQSGQFVSVDWFTAPPVAFDANGYVEVDNGSFSAVNSGDPNLYSAEILLSNTVSSVTGIDLSFNSGGPYSHCVVFAVSGAAGALAPSLDVQPQSTNCYEGSNVMFSVGVSGTAPLSFQWQKAVSGAYVNLSDAGNISGSATTNLSISDVSLADAGNYVFVVSNAAGSVTSSVAMLNVLSSLPDVLGPSDAIALWPTNSHEAEAVSGAVDHTTAKYLNLGVGSNPGAAPFVGPGGFVDTPAIGSTRVNGMRTYTANDSPERDPADYTLEGSNDGGTNFTLISSGSLSLPEGRNPEGAAIDPIAQFNQEVDFANSAFYTTYRVSWNHVRNDALANSAAVAEVELLGVAAGTTGILSATANTNGTLTISTTLPGQLQFTTALNGSNTVWQNAGGISGVVTVHPTGPATFYRVLVQ